MRTWLLNILKETARSAPFMTIQLYSSFQYIGMREVNITLPVLKVGWKNVEWGKGLEGTYQLLACFFCAVADADGRNVNIPWPTAEMGDSDYLYAFTRIVLPIAYEFAPELVMSEYSEMCEFSSLKQLLHA